MTELVTDHAWMGTISETTSTNYVQSHEHRSGFSPFTTYRRAKRFGSLDGWRACAVLGVLWHHTAGFSFASRIAQEGRHGVTLFFVISGFLIITIILRSRESPAGFTIWKFWGRRALRILPIYYLVLALYAVLVRYTDHSPSGVAFFGNIRYFVTFTSNWLVDHSSHTIFYFSWSLAAEEQFYLVWPLVEVLIVEPLPKFILLAVAAGASQTALAYTAFSQADSLPVRMLTSMPLGIMLGTILAHVLHNEAGFRFAYRLLGQRGSAFACLAVAVVVAILSPALGFFGEVAVPLVFFLLVGATVIREDNDLAGVLSWRPLVWIGTVSYGMYLMHMLAINLVRVAGQRLGVSSPSALFLGSVGVAVALASASFILYERRFLVLKDRLFRD